MRPTEAVVGGGEAAFVEANLRRNVGAIAGEMGFFGLALSLAATATVLPAFARHLGASNLVIGLLPAIMTVGWGLPSVLSAHYAERRQRLLPLVMAVTIWERLPYLPMALAAALLAEREPTLALVVTLGFFTLAAFSGGVFMPAWMGLIAKCIPSRARGRSFALGHIASGLTGVGGAALAGYFLRDYPFPLSYALCFFVAFLASMISFAFLTQVREYPSPSTKPPVPLLAYLRRLPAVLRGDRRFSAYLLARALTLGGTMGNGFFAVYGLSRLGAGDEQVAVFTFFLMAAQTVSTGVWGQLADRRGHRLVLILGALATGTASVLALTATEVPRLYAVFALLGAANGALNVSHMNITLEFSPPADRPTYVGLGGTTMAPFALLAPVVGGLLADGPGFGAVFATAATFALLSVACLTLVVQDPRRRGSVP